MTLLYVGLLGLGITLVLSGVYNIPYVATVQSILSGQPLSATPSSGGGTGNQAPPVFQQGGAGTKPFPPGIK